LGSLIITSSRACFRIPTLPSNRYTVRHSKSWRRNTGIRVRNNHSLLDKFSESSSQVTERDALRSMVLLRWSAGAAGVGSAPGGAIGGARFGVLGERQGARSKSGKRWGGRVPVAGDRGVEWPRAKPPAHSKIALPPRQLPSGLVTKILRRRRAGRAWMLSPNDNSS
jgi:hypothetical protein